MLNFSAEEPNVTLLEDGQWSIVWSSMENSCWLASTALLKAKRKPWSSGPPFIGNLPSLQNKIMFTFPKMLSLDLLILESISSTLLIWSDKSDRSCWIQFIVFDHRWLWFTSTLIGNFMRSSSWCLQCLFRILCVYLFFVLGVRSGLLCHGCTIRLTDLAFRSLFVHI